MSMEWKWSLGTTTRRFKSEILHFFWHARESVSKLLRGLVEFANRRVAVAAYINFARFDIFLFSNCNIKYYIWNMIVQVAVQCKVCYTFTSRYHFCISKRFNNSNFFVGCALQKISMFIQSGYIHLTWEREQSREREREPAE